MNDKKIFVGGTLIVILIIFGAYFFLSDNQKPTAKIDSYQATNKQRPQVQTSQTVADLGEMKVSDVKSYDFTVKNIGSAPLQLSQITSSCGCTFGQVIYEGVESNKFGMHVQNNYVAEISPQKEAIVRVIYQPSIMPVYGAVERDVYVTTNDPQNPKLTFQVKAFVK